MGNHYFFYNAVTRNWLLANGIAIAKANNVDPNLKSYDELNKLYLDSLPKWQQDMVAQLDLQTAEFLKTNTDLSDNYAFSSFSLGNASVTRNAGGSMQTTRRLIDALPTDLLALFKNLGWLHSFKSFALGYSEISGWPGG